MNVISLREAIGDIIEKQRLFNEEMVISEHLTRKSLVFI